MSASSQSQSALTPDFLTNKCSSAIRKKVFDNPETPDMWDILIQDHVARSGTGNQLEPELDRSHDYIHLSGSNRWKAGDEKASGSALHLEHFLHLRALVQNHRGDFPLRDLVEPKYADGAEAFLTEWPDFRRYIDQVHVNDPAMDLDSLGEFSGPKRVQNQVLLDSYLGTIQHKGQSQDEGDSFKYSTAETPLKKGSPDVGVNFNGTPTGDDAADEQIVNEALISFASVLTRRWMVQRTSIPYSTDVTPSKGSNVTAHGWRTAADWTMSRDRFHIRARCRQGERVQAGHMAGLKYSSMKRRKDDYEKLSDGCEYGRIFTSEIDGSLYSIGRNSTEILAIVEVKKRLRPKNRLAIEWQEASEILAWLNMRLRDEAGANGPKAKGSSTARRGMLKPKPATGTSFEKSRCLLVAQDREEIYLVIGEWDKLYEEYALEGRFSGQTIKLLKNIHKQVPGSDAGFLTLHVYGPYGSSAQTALARGSSMRALSTNLLALSLHLSQASCSPLSRRPTPPASIKLPTPRGEPCCPGCTCGCGCGRPPGGPGTSGPPPGPPKPPSETSETSRGGKKDPREGPTSRPPSDKTPSTRSTSSSSSGVPDPTPSRAPRPGGRKPDEIRAASAHCRDPRQDPGPLQAQGHGILPVRGRPTTSSEQRGPRTESEEQASRSGSRARATAAIAGHPGQGPAPIAASRHPAVPEVPGRPVQVSVQQRQPQQQQGQRDARAQGSHGAQLHHDPRHAATSSATEHQGGTAYDQAQQRPQTRAQTAGHHGQQTHHDSSSEPGPSTQRTPARPAALDIAEPSQLHRSPGDLPAKSKKHPLSPKNLKWPFKLGKDPKDKKGKDQDEDDKKGKGTDDNNNDKGGGGKK